MNPTKRNFYFFLRKLRILCISIKKITYYLFKTRNIINDAYDRDSDKISNKKLYNILSMSDYEENNIFNKNPYLESSIMDLLIYRDNQHIYHTERFMFNLVKTIYDKYYMNYFISLFLWGLISYILVIITINADYRFSIIGAAIYCCIIPFISYILPTILTELIRILIFVLSMLDKDCKFIVYDLEEMFEIVEDSA